MALVKSKSFPWASFETDISLILPRPAVVELAFKAYELTFHNGKKAEAKEVLWPHLLALAEDEDLGPAVLRAFGVEGELPKDIQGRVASLIACFA